MLQLVCHAMFAELLYYSTCRDKRVFYLACYTNFAVPVEINLCVMFGLLYYVCSSHKDKLVCCISFVMLCLKYP